MAKMALNEYIIDEDCCYLMITTKNNAKVYFAIDKEDLPKLKKFHWHVLYAPKQHAHYVENTEKEKLHRFIMNTPDDKVVDHLDRCPYNNRKENLRNCTVLDNNRNRRYPEFHKKPKVSKLGISYISKKYFGEKAYYDVRYHNYKRRYFKNLEDAKEYLKELQDKERK